MLENNTAESLCHYLECYTLSTVSILTSSVVLVEEEIKRITELSQISAGKCDIMK